MRRKQREIKQHVRSEYYRYVKTNVLTSVSFLPSYQHETSGHKGHHSGPDGG